MLSWAAHNYLITQLFKLHNYLICYIKIIQNSTKFKKYCLLLSYFLYNISHPTKYGVPQLELSLDIEAPASLSHNQLLIEKVICKTSTQYRCDVIITDHLRSLFTNKLARMGKAWYKLGGRGRTSQIEKWKETTWLLTLQPNEIVSKTKKRKAENVFIQDQVKKIA